MTKKSTLLTMALFVCAGAFAGPSINAPKCDVQKKMSLRLDALKERAEKLQTPPTRGEIGEIISDVKGESKIYSKEIQGYDWGYYTESTYAAKIVFGENNEVYFKDIICAWSEDTYVKGELKDGVITVPVGQTIFDYGLYAINVNVLKRIGSGEDTNYVIADNIDSFQYKVSDSGVIELTLPGAPGDYMLGTIYTDDDGWTYDGDFTQVFTPFNENFYSMPENVVPEELMLNDYYYGHKVNLAFDGDYAYIEGLSSAIPDGVMKGRVEGNKIYIPQDQYVGTFYNYFIVTKVCYPDEEQGMVLAPEDLEFVLIYDAEKKLVTCEDPELMLIYNAALDRVYYVDFYQNFVLQTQTSFEGTPLNPWGLEWDDSYINYYGLNIFSFYMPNIATNGNVLLDNNLYYRIFVDDEIYEFEYDEEEEIYPGIEGTVTDIPYTFDNGWDISYYTQISRAVYLYFEGVTTVGVQSVNKYQGVEYASERVTLNIENGNITTGIKAFEGAKITGEVYYDLNGRRIANPEKGIFIRQTTLSDGSIIAGKVVRK